MRQYRGQVLCDVSFILKSVPFFPLEVFFTEKVIFICMSFCSKDYLKWL